MSVVEQWYSDLSQSSTEEDVKAAYAKALGLKYNTSDRHDLYTPSALFEFKYDKSLSSIEARARVLAQLLYYIRELRFGTVKKQIPTNLILADKNECAITQTDVWSSFIEDSIYDWDLSPSSPDQKLVDDLSASLAVRELHVFNLSSSVQRKTTIEQLKDAVSSQKKLFSRLKKIITEDNFIDVFDYWRELFGASVENGIKPSTYFVQDIQAGRSHLIADQGKVIFEFEDGTAVTKKILKEDYDHFWSLYDKVTDTHTIRAIIAKIDRLNDMTSRRFEGEFYTPLPFAKKGIEYLQKTIGKDWHKKQIRIWDMAAGTGNLEWYLPNEMTMELYVSTLHHDEVEHCQKLFLGATCFQYDYLNDDVDKLFGASELLSENWKLPKKLRDELADESIHWIVLINPPFGTAQTAGANSLSKKSVSMTAIQKHMHAEGLGEVSRELFEQFLFRIYKEMPKARTHLGLFSKLKFINATNDRKFRDKAFQHTFERGFIFAASNFHGTKGKFPVGFSVWDLSRQQHLEEQTILLDVFDSSVHKIGQKTVASIPKEQFLSNWIDRPRTSSVFPPFKSAINVATGNKDTRDRVAEGFIGSLDCAGNDPQNSNRVGVYSGPFATAGALSITPENFEKAMVVHAVRRIVPNTWVNDRDQFLQPRQELAREFIDDCVVWGLFANSNQTSSLKDVRHKDIIYQVVNQFFPFRKEVISKWKIDDRDIALGIATSPERYVASWLIDGNLSEDATALISAGRAVYKVYFENLTHLRTPMYKIDTWDAGWWQIRNSLYDMSLATSELSEVSRLRKLLEKKLLLQIYHYGFISTELDIV